MSREMVTRKEIMDRLSQVVDPELGLDIVNMGLIYEVTVKRKEKGRPQQVAIRMTFTTPACPLMNVILDDIKARLEPIKDTDIDIQIVFEPLWSPDRMSEKARLKLGMI